jgi:hypothetical protein
VLTELLVRVRRQALFEHDPDAGDGPWGLGCKCYERSVFEIVEVAKSHGWLTIIERHPAFQFAIGAVPMRFLHGFLRDPAHAHTETAPYRAASYAAAPR